MAKRFTEPLAARATALCLVSFPNSPLIIIFCRGKWLSQPFAVANVSVNLVAAVSGPVKVLPRLLPLHRVLLVAAAVVSVSIASQSIFGLVNVIAAAVGPVNYFLRKSFTATNLPAQLICRGKIIGTILTQIPRHIALTTLAATKHVVFYNGKVAA